MISITVHNDDINDLFVSVFDLNTAGGPAVLDKVRINADQPKTTQVQEDGSGVGKVTWQAWRADDPTVTKASTAQPSANDTVNVNVFGV